MRILVIEDNRKLALSLKRGFEQEGYAADAILDGNEGEKRMLLNHKDYDILILDLMLPGKGGVEICRSLRENGIPTPILMLTAKDTTEDTIMGLDSGADDYMVKPYSFEELLSRIRALARRPRESHSPDLRVGDLVLSSKSQEVFNGSEKMNLTLKEFRILEFFMQHPDEVLSRQKIVDHLWDFAFNPLSRVMDVHINNLRNKLEAHKNHGPILETVRGIGYRLDHNVFFWARLKLTGLYVLIVAVIISGFSLFLYENILHNVRDADQDDFADVQSHQHFASLALDSLQKDILFADLIILCAAAGLSYTLAGWTLKPAQRSAEAQQAFAANASHELRTPLAVMTNDVEVLLRNKSPRQEDMRATLNSNLEELRHMSHIVESLLVLARSSNQTRSSFDAMNLEDVLRKVIEKTSVVAAGNGVKLNASIVPVHIQGDPSSIERAVQNVIHNSLKHTPSGGTVTIDLKREQHQAVIQITDTGSGIDPHDLSHVFERFYKGKGVENENGAGLGLTIVKDIMERHGGSISIDSTQGKGTTVSIRLPHA